MTETATTCRNNGGTGIGAGHRCECVRPAGHPSDSERPHGCSCGALWADGRGQRCTWCFGSGEWTENRQIVPCKKCSGTGNG